MLDLTVDHSLVGADQSLLVGFHGDLFDSEGQNLLLPSSLDGRIQLEHIDFPHLHLNGRIITCADDLSGTMRVVICSSSNSERLSILGDNCSMMQTGVALRVYLRWVSVRVRRNWYLPEFMELRLRSREMWIAIYWLEMIIFSNS